MARVNYKYEKRRRDLAKKKKKEEKRLRKLAEKNKLPEDTAGNITTETTEKSFES